jgi:hypothetical protein
MFFKVIYILRQYDKQATFRNTWNLGLKEYFMSNQFKFKTISKFVFVNSLLEYIIPTYLIYLLMY